jgi:hypothetical protein
VCISSHQRAILIISNHFVFDLLVVLEVVSEMAELLSLSCICRDERNARELVGGVLLLLFVYVGRCWSVFLLMMYFYRCNAI